MDNLDCPIILVMGLTGAGKSSFVRNLVEKPDEYESSIGHGLIPNTLDVVEHPVKIGRETVILVDTPGLDHPGYVFEDVAQWMSGRDHPINFVDGIILLHPISRNRMTEDSVAVGSLREEFSKLLGIPMDSRFPFYKVALATTHWVDENAAINRKAAEEDYAGQIKRERELQNDWWKLLEVQGAMFRRHDNTTECARDIVWSILKAQVPEERAIHIRDQLIIAVVGSTQAGKSSFIKALTMAASPNEIEARMNSIEPYEIELNGENVIVLDTPGLDSTSDPGGVFQMISEWLRIQAKEVPSQQLRLDGMVVVHPIMSKQDERFGDIVLQSVLIEHVNKLFGGLKMIHDDRDINAYRRVVLATTKWDELGQDDLETAAKREMHIRRSNWNIMHIAGAPIVRFDNTPESAQRTIASIVEEKKSGDATYQYRNIKATLDEIKLGLERVQGEFGDIHNKQASYSETMEALCRIPSLDKFIDAACQPRD